MSTRSRSYALAFVTAMCFAMAPHRTTAQSPEQPSALSPSNQTNPPTQFSPSPRDLSQKEIDALVARAFGPESPEMRRPVRLYFAGFGAVVAAREASLSDDGRSVRLVEVSVRVASDAKILHGESMVVELAQRVEKVSDAPRSFVNQMVVSQKDRTVTFSNPANFDRNSEEAKVDGPVPNPISPDGVRRDAQIDIRSLNIRFNFKLDPMASPSTLLPAAPAPAKLPAPLNDDLSKVPELMMGDPMSRTLSKLTAMETIAHSSAKINHLNASKVDGFMLALFEKRTDLRGLPVLMGDDCRTREEQAQVFAEVAEMIQQALQSIRKGPDNLDTNTEEFWAQLAELNIMLVEPNVRGKPRIAKASQEHLQKAMVGALMQILMPESELLRVGLAKYLSTIPHIDATRALAKLAIFSAEEEVRAAAIDALKLRRERDYTEVLLQGLRYPLPAVAKRSAEAFVKLERTDMLAELIDVLERPDPRLPVTTTEAGKDVTTVRELVRINHHRNCLLCHAPGNTENVPRGVLKVAVPLPSEPLTNPTEGGGYSKSPPTGDILVRLDMTYLRQDFSLRMPVADAHPWPDMQRFDFLVRQRTLTPEEAKAYPSGISDVGRLPPHHRAALFALRELTGRDTEPTAAAWRKMLKVGKS